VFPVRYGLDSCILFQRNSVFEVLTHQHLYPNTSVSVKDWEPLDTGGRLGAQNGNRHAPCDHQRTVRIFLECFKILAGIWKPFRGHTYTRLVSRGHNVILYGTLYVKRLADDGRGPPAQGTY
jgi:hypothetical protein